MTIDHLAPGSLGRRAGLSLAVIVSGLLGTPLSPASATFPGADGRIVFARGGDVWTAGISASAYSERRLTFDGITRNPRWSPDGTRIVFNTRGGNIGVMSATGTNSRTLVSGRSYQPAWSPVSPGGQVIAFVRVPLGMPGDIWSVPATGGRESRVTWDGAASCGNAWPSWSSTGTHIAYLRYGKGPDGECRTGDDTTRVVVFDLGTKAMQVVPDYAPYGSTYPITGRPDFAPGGMRVQYMTWSSCEEVVVSYDVSSRQLSERVTNYSCEGGNSLREAAPTPSDGLATVYTYAGDPWGAGGPGVCVALPAGRRCTTDFSAGWASIDVQPRP